MYRLKRLAMASEKQPILPRLRLKSMRREPTGPHRWFWYDYGMSIMQPKCIQTSRLSMSGVRNLQIRIGLKRLWHNDSPLARKRMMAA